MPTSNLFKWCHFHAEIILLNVRWYLRYGLSYRDLEEMMVERGVAVGHTTVCCWVQAYSPELDKRCRRYLRPSNDLWRVDETYIKVKKRDHYLYRAVDSSGQTLDFMLSAKRDAKAAQRFFRKALNAPFIISCNTTQHNQQKRPLLQQQGIEVQIIRCKIRADRLIIFSEPW